MFLSVNIMYLFMKLVFFYSLVRALIKYDTLRDHWLFLGLLYSGGIAFLSYIFIFGWQQIQWPAWQLRIAQTVGVSPYVAWVGETFLLSTLYFRFLSKIEEGAIFWVLILLGLALVWF